jgi:hypothetical protein
VDWGTTRGVYGFAAPSHVSSRPKSLPRKRNDSEIHWNGADALRLKYMFRYSVQMRVLRSKPLSSGSPREFERFKEEEPAGLTLLRHAVARRREDAPLVVCAVGREIILQSFLFSASNAE